MPLYEYICKKCNHGFEELVFGNVSTRCPRCDDTKVERVLSVTARTPTDRGGDFAAAGPCGNCGHPDGPGSCKFDG